MELIKSVTERITKVTHTIQDPDLGVFECIEYIDESGNPIHWVLHNEDGHEIDDERLLEEVQEMLF